MIGKKLGHYEVLDLLGRGGMGEVYRARDTSLGREVALKLLPPELLSDPERVARFRREARTLASLNHAHIAGLHGVEEHDGHRFLVMELAEGEDLSVRIEGGPLPLDEALEIAGQIADGLEEAHEQGIVHRDLKPANIKVSTDGRVKILDFGLARAFLGETVDESDLGHSPTITAAMTQAGVILGTAAYMSPEQAKGRTVDRRADVWSFGVILWEMLTGQRLFQAETTSEVLAAVLRADPPWEELPDSVPVGVRRLLERCLERDPRRRLRDIGEARVRLEGWQADPDTLHESAIGLEPAAEAKSARAMWLPWALLAVASLVAVWGWMGRGPATVEDSSSLRLSILVPGHEQLPQAGGGGPALKLSRDGTRLAYNSGNVLWLRRLDSMDVQRVEGSDGVRNFTFSPDGRWVAYVAGGKLYRASVTGGAPIEICDAPDPRGIAWVNDTTIVFPPTYLDGIHRVSLETGEVTPLTEIDSGRGERSHRWPMPLPGGRKILITCQFSGRDYDESDIQIVSLDTGERRTIYRGGSFGVYTTSGHLLFVRDTTVFAVELDLDSGETRGLPVPVISGIESSVGDQESDNGSAHFDVSAGGLFIYRTLASASRRTRLAAFDFETETVSPFGGEGLHARPARSPDGRWLAVGRGAGDDRRLFIFDTATRLERQFTRREGRNQLGCWSPDSRALYWTSTSGGDGLWWILHQPIDGSAPVDSVASSSDTLLPTSISPDGRWLYLTHWTGANGWDIVRVDLQDPEPSLQTVLGGARNEQQALLSPDGNWMTYFSDESGNFQLYLRRVPDTGAVWQLTRESSVWYGSAWTDDGTGLWVRSDLGFHRIDVDLSGNTVQISPLRLFAEENFQRNNTFSSLAPYPDGTGAYVMVGTEGTEEAQSEVILITDWFPQLSALVSASR